jgi:hypothetical protein
MISCSCVCVQCTRTALSISSVRHPKHLQVSSSTRQNLIDMEWEQLNLDEFDQKLRPFLTGEFSLLISRHRADCRRGLVLLAWRAGHRMLR